MCHEHGAVFGWFQQLPAVATPGVLMWLVPLLALPQSRHYVLDGFLWRRELMRAPGWQRAKQGLAWRRG